MPQRIVPGRPPHPPTIIAADYQKHLHGDGTPEYDLARGKGHHINLGPGAELETTWRAAGLELPDLDVVRSYRLGRVVEQLQQSGYDGIFVMDPLNIRYITDATNMQVWVAHDACRYAFLSASGYLVLWDYINCEFLAGHNDNIDEVRPSLSSIFFCAGDRWRDVAARWVDEVASVIKEHCGDGARIAVDQINYYEGTRLASAGITIERGQAVMERARLVKCDDEIKAMRCAAAACVATMDEMRETLRPGLTERDIWAVLHAGNIKRGGEWIETQLLASGERTNPWFQEASSRVLQDGDFLAYDTDLIGAYGMCIDISRTWLVGDAKPTYAQEATFALAHEQIVHNLDLLRPGISLRDLTFKSKVPPVEDYRHYSVLYHGVGLCDEYPSVYFPESWDSIGYNDVVQPGWVMTVESFVGPRNGGQGVKLEEQVLITENGFERLLDYPLGAR